MVDGVLIFYYSFLMSHYNLLRSDNLLSMELPDLFSIKIHVKQDKPLQNRCTILAIVINNGKTNKHGRYFFIFLKRIEYGGSIRAQSVQTCLHSALSLTMFARFHIFHEVLVLVTKLGVAGFYQK